MGIVKLTYINGDTKRELSSLNGNWLLENGGKLFLHNILDIQYWGHNNWSNYNMKMLRFIFIFCRVKFGKWELLSLPI